MNAPTAAISNTPPIPDYLPINLDIWLGGTNPIIKVGSNMDGKFRFRITTTFHREKN